MKNLNEVIIDNPEPYKSILEFIKQNVVPKYPCLTYCFQNNFDEEGNPRVQYFIKYAADLTVGQWDELFKNILRDILEFCSLRGIEYGEELGVDFILSIDGDYYNERCKK